MMIMVTGCVSSGTSLIALYLQRLGVDMGVEIDETAFDVHSSQHKTYEDEEFYDLVMNISTKNFPTKKFQTLIQQKNKPYWGFKLPRAILYWNHIIKILIENVDNLTVIHSFRDLGANLESWTRKRLFHDHLLDDLNFDTIMKFNIAALKAYSVFKNQCRFIFLNPEYLILYPEQFWIALDIPKHYYSQEHIFKINCLRSAKKEYMYPQDYLRMYDIMEHLKWKP